MPFVLLQCRSVAFLHQPQQELSFGSAGAPATAGPHRRVTGGRRQFT
ncbi:MAG: hypothetical protein ACOYXW_06990 [Actinomycetota bacterium]